MKAPELIRNIELLVACRHQMDTRRPDPDAPRGRFALRWVFGGVAVLVMLASGIVKNIQP